MFHKILNALVSRKKNIKREYDNKRNIIYNLKL